MTLTENMTGAIFTRDSKLDWLSLFKLLRMKYLRTNLLVQDLSLINRMRINYKELPTDNLEYLKINQFLEKNYQLDWGNWQFHLKNRMHLNNKSSDNDFSIFFDLVKHLGLDENFYFDLIRNGIEINGNGENSHGEKHFYDLSILPLNLLLGPSVIDYFLPPNDYLISHSTKQSDPYGLIYSKTRAVIGNGEPTPIIDKETNLILGAHKFSNTLLFNIDFYCPVGCSDCYKTRFGTREYITSEKRKKDDFMKFYNHPSLGKLLPPSKSTILNQAKKVVEWMNETQRGGQVRDLILSGGEPFILTNDVIKGLLNELQYAKNLQILRICTGSLFLGLPFRMEDSLLNILSDFSKTTSIRITFQTHLGNIEMFSPESLIAIRKIRQREFTIYTQVPIKNGINFFFDDIDKTINYLAEFGRIQFLSGVEPYMYIVDMHPSTNKFYVPIEPLMMVWGKLVESHDYPGLERPKTLSVLCNEGNIILSGHTLFSSKKIVDKVKDKVTYIIPRVEGRIQWQPYIKEFYTFEEPLLVGVNDNPNSLDILRKEWFK